MDAAQHALLQHLQAALSAYGPELTLPVPPPIPASAPAPSRPAAAQERTAAPPPRPALVVTPPAQLPAASVVDLAPTTAPAPAAPRALPRPPASPPAASQPAVGATAAGAPPPAAQDPFDALRAEVFGCRKCKLCTSRKSVVFGEGTRSPEVLFVGEAPGAVEDQTGRPFVGPAGQLLDKILQGAMGLERADVFIANVNKCRPPGNRDPEPDEVASCLPFLQRQVELLRPKVIVALGRVAAHNLLGTSEPMRVLRGRDLAYQGIPVVVTWHPAFLLRDPSHKRETWEDIKRVNRLLGRPEVPGSA